MFSKQSLYSDIAHKRIIQIFWSIEISLFLAFLQRLYLTAYLNAIIIVISMIAFMPVHALVKKNQHLPAVILLLTIATLFCSYFMWSFGGVHDEIILAYPVILIMAAVLGNKKLFIGLMLFINASIAINGVVNQQGWMINNSVLSANYMDSTIVTLIILSLLSYLISILSNDLQLLLDKLSKEHLKTLASKEEIEKLLNHDTLTGLPNRAMAYSLFQCAKKNKSLTSLMFIDIDNFKEINDGLGHKAGDELLKEVTTRLLTEVSDAGTVCRLAGDEFIVILASVEHENKLSQIAHNIITNVKKPFEYNDNELICGCSIGISTSVNALLDFDTLVQQADKAMYQSKSMGGSCFHFFNSTMSSEENHYLSTVADLRKAIKENEFELYFQPQIHLNSQKVIGTEALIRWNHPQKGIIYPEAFIPQAEQSGLIVEIGAWLLQAACEKCHSWHILGQKELSISVNLSAKQYQQNSFIQVVEKALKDNQLPAKNLVIGITESVLINHSDELEKALQHLSFLGVTFAINDFGPGYSNLNNLKNINIQTLKIDRSFVQNIEHNKKNKVLASAIIQIAKGFSLQTIAEGVETEDAATVLFYLGCDYGQSNYWAKPVSEDKFIALFA